MVPTFTRRYDVQLSHEHYPPLHGMVEMRLTVDSRKIFIVAKGMGCSRDYPMDSDTDAIRTFAAEHGARVVSIQGPNF